MNKRFCFGGFHARCNASSAILRRVLKRIDSSLRQVFPVTFLLERKGLALDDEDVFDAIAEKVLSRRRTRSRENGVRQ